MRGLISNPSPSDPAAVELVRRLNEFYATTRDYTAFLQTPDHAAEFAHVIEALKGVLARQERAAVLELGAGRSDFGDALGALRPRVDYDVQDVTPQNRDYLAARARRLLIGDITAIAGPYDVIFHTYVLEHVTTPTTFLAEADRLLSPGGVHVIICPRYDAPGYLCPSLRHLGRAARAGMLARLALSRAAARVDRRERFYVNTDLAMFHRPWFRDADAVHLVSRPDVERWHLRRGYTIQRLRFQTRGWRELVLRRYLTLAIAARKPASPPAL